MKTLMHTQVAIKVNAVKNEYTATWEMWKPIGIYSLTFVSACFSHNENKIWDNFAFGEFEWICIKRAMLMSTAFVK